MALFTKGEVKVQGLTFEITLPDGEVQDQKEIYFYINRAANPKFSINGKRVSAFQLDQPLLIEMDDLAVEFSFQQKDNAQFYGHIAYGNRDNQLLKDQEAYDHSIGIRTVRRSQTSTLIIRLKLL